MSYLPEAINWIDLETTGLDPEKCVILEVALVTTSAELNENGKFCGAHGSISWRVPHAPGSLVMNRWCWDTHERSGLLADVGDAHKENRLPLSRIDEDLAACTVRGAPLGGSSPHFDLAFIKRYLPKTAARLGHRVIDVSTLLAFAESAGYTIDAPPAEHRALGDIHRSINIAEQVLRHMKGLTK